MDEHSVEITRSPESNKVGCVITERVVIKDKDQLPRTYYTGRGEVTIIKPDGSEEKTTVEEAKGRILRDCDIAVSVDDKGKAIIQALLVGNTFFRGGKDGLEGFTLKSIEKQFDFYFGADQSSAEQKKFMLQNFKINSN